MKFKGYVYILTCFLFIIAIVSGNSYIQNAALKQESPTGIARVSFMCNVHLQFISLNVSIQYIQLRESSEPFVDTIAFVGNISHIAVRDVWNNNLLLTSYYNSSTGLTEVSLRLPRVLNVGEKYLVYVLAITSTQIGSNSWLCNVGVMFSQTVSVFSATAILDKNLILYSANPTPQSISTIDQRIQMSWDTIMLDSFLLEIRFGSTLVSQDIIVFPDLWYVGSIASNRKPLIQSFEITNLRDITLTITITSNISQIILPAKLIIAPHGKISVDISIDISHQGVIQGSIFFATNSSQQLIDCPVYVNVKNSINPWNIALIIVVLGLLSLNILQYYRKTSINRKKIVLSVTKSNDTSKSTVDISNLKSFFNDREFAVISEVLDNPGISQSQVALRTNIPKATVSRIITKLENKGLLIKKNVGMSNILYVNTDSPIFKNAKKTD
ncbi:MAG: helix-turn-helix transcriptional regulator [Candidatus Heimdallarchaeaceae archaeon]